MLQSEEGLLGHLRQDLELLHELNVEIMELGVAFAEGPVSSLLYDLYRVVNSVLFEWVLFVLRDRNLRHYEG